MLIKRRIVPPLAAVALLCLLAGARLAAGGAAHAGGPCDAGGLDFDASERTMLELVNAARAGHALTPLVPNVTLTRAAAWKSADPSAGRVTFSHTDSLGRDFGTRMRDCAYPWAAGENIADGSADPSVIIGAWLASPAHRALILGGEYVVVGIARVGEQWTLLEGDHDDGSGQPPQLAVAAAPASRLPAFSSHMVLPMLAGE